MTDEPGRFELRRNLGAWDRVIRGVIGFTLITLSYQRVVTGGLGIAATTVGVVLFVESLVAY